MSKRPSFTFREEGAAYAHGLRGIALTPNNPDEPMGWDNPAHMTVYFEPRNGHKCIDVIKGHIQYDRHLYKNIEGKERMGRSKEDPRRFVPSHASLSFDTISPRQFGKFLDHYEWVGPQEIEPLREWIAATQHETVLPEGVDDLTNAPRPDIANPREFRKTLAAHVCAIDVTPILSAEPGEKGTYKIEVIFDALKPGRKWEAYQAALEERCETHKGWGENYKIGRLKYDGKHPAWVVTTKTPYVYRTLDMLYDCGALRDEELDFYRMDLRSHVDPLPDAEKTLEEPSDETFRMTIARQQQRNR